MNRCAAPHPVIRVTVPPEIKVETYSVIVSFFDKQTILALL
jgi:hypothetical protein